MKLDKIKFARLIGFIQRQYAISFSATELHEIDNMIDIDAPEASKALTHEVDELLRCMLSANSDGFIPAIRAYRVLTGAGLKESKDAIERYRTAVKQVG